MAYKFNPFTGKLEEYGPILTGTGTVAAAADGTAALPGISFANDLSVGIYRPGAEQLAFSTNGTGRLFVDASGKILVNQSSQLSNATGQVVETNGNIVINSTTTGAGQAASLDFYHLVSTGTATRLGSKIDSFAEGSYTAGLGASNDSGLRFYTTQDGTSTERLRITSAGLVGIGTSSPQAALDIFTSTGTYFRGGSDDSARQLIIASSATTNAGDTHTFQAGSSTGVLAFKTFNAERLRIDSSGRVGIGTTSPSVLLHVQDDSLSSTTPGTNIVARFQTNGANRDASILLGDTTNSASRIGQNNGSLTFHPGSATERARIDSSGRLLVGTSSSPSGVGGYGRLSPLVVQGYSLGGTTGGGYISLQKGEAASTITTNEELGAIHFNDNDGFTFGRILCSADGNAGAGDYPGRLVFSTTADGASSPTERMRIGQSGIVDIGSGGVGGGLRVMVASGSAMQFSNTNTATTNLTFIEFGRSASSPGFYTAEGTIGTDGSGNLAFTNASDVNLKENIRDLNACLETIKSLRPVLFDWKTDYKPCCTDVKGFIAQEFEQVLPKSVSTDEAGIKSVSPVSELLPILVGAIKELTVQVAELEAKVAALESA